MVGKRGIDPRMVKIPGTLVDALVLAPDQKQTYQIDYDPALMRRIPRRRPEYGKALP